MDPYQKEDAPTSLCFFTSLVLVVQGLGLLSVILVSVWMGNYLGGFAWSEDPDRQFNYHPVFMVIGMIFLYSDSILAYRVFRNVKKLYVKILHASFHIGALIFSAVGLKAVFDFHNAKSMPNLYSLHSWIGLVTIILFGLQWVCGFIAFLFPKLSYGMRTRYMSHHVFWGLTILGMAVGAALTGIMEKAWFMNFAKDSKFKYSSLPAQGLVINCLGVSIISMVIIVFYLVTRPEYKRPKGPEEEEHIQLSNN